MNWFRKLINRLTRKNVFNQYKKDVKYAFTCDGVDYYQFSDFSNMPALRGLKTMVFYEEMKMKCTLQYLKYHCEAVDNILTASKIDVYKLKALNDQMQMRLNMALDTELIYKLSSVVFFDENENVSDYDFEYNKKKIERFKNSPSADFFLLAPVQELLPVLKDLGENLRKYSQAVEIINQTHLDNLLQSLPEDKTQILKDKSYFSAMVMHPN